MQISTVVVLGVCLIVVFVILYMFRDQLNVKLSRRWPFVRYGIEMQDAPSDVVELFNEAEKRIADEPMISGQQIIYELRNYKLKGGDVRYAENQGINRGRGDGGIGDGGIGDGRNARGGDGRNASTEAEAVRSSTKASDIVYPSPAEDPEVYDTSDGREGQGYPAAPKQALHNGVGRPRPNLVQGRTYQQANSAERDSEGSERDTEKPRKSVFSRIIRRK